MRAANDSPGVGKLGILVPVSVAVAGFFSWVILINRLQIPFYVYFQGTIFLVYFTRSLDLMIWLSSSVLAVVLLAGLTRTRSAWLWPAILLLWSGIALGVLGVVGLLEQGMSAAEPLLTLAGCVVGAIGTLRGLTSTGRGHFMLVLLLALSLLVIPAELGSLLYYVTSAFNPGAQLGVSWESLDQQLWYSAFPLIPFLYIIFLFSWIWAPLLTRMSPKSLSFLDRTFAKHPNPNQNRGRTWVVPIAACFVLAFFLGYYPYFHDASHQLVGTDIYWMNANPVHRVLSSTSWVTAAAQERHPIVVLSLAALSRLFGVQIESLLRFAYVELILVFSGAMFLLVSRASGNKMLASFVALMSTVSPPTTDGIYTGIIANWVAAIIWILTFASLARATGQGRRAYAASILSLALGSLAILFIHPWTWLAVMVGLVAYSLIAICIRLKGVGCDLVSVLVSILLNAGALALGFLVLQKAQGWREAEAFSLVRDTLGSKYFGLGSWEIVAFFSQIWSRFLNPVVLVLVIVGVVVLACRRDRLSAIVFAWLVASCATSVLAAPMGYDPAVIGRGETQLFRALFLTPFQIPLAVAFLMLGSVLERKLTDRVGARAAKIVVYVVLAVVFLIVVNGALRSLFPLLSDPHNYAGPNS